MSTFRVIARREMRLALRNRSIFITAVIFAIWFGHVRLRGRRLGGTPQPLPPVSPRSSSQSVFMGYIFCAGLPPRSGTAPSDAPRTPVSLRRLWREGCRGRRAGIPDDPRLGRGDRRGLSTLTGIPVAAEPLLLLHLAVIVPVWVVASAGLIGAAQLVLGMRENQILGFVFIFGFFFLIFGLQEVAAGGPGISLVTEGILAVAGVALVALARFIAGKVTKERVVLTIP